MSAAAVWPTGSSSVDWGLSYPELGGNAADRRQPARALGYPLWYRPVKERILELLRLADNWDGRGARQVSERDLEDAVAFIVRVMRPDTAAPWIGPLSSGGIQLTWRRDDVELEAVFDRARGERVIILTVGDNEWEEPAEHAASLFATVVDRLSVDHAELPTHA